MKKNISMFIKLTCQGFGMRTSYNVYPCVDSSSKVLHVKVTLANLIANFEKMIFQIILQPLKYDHKCKDFTATFNNFVPLLTLLRTVF